MRALFALLVALPAVAFGQVPDEPRDFMRQFMTCEWIETSAAQQACREELVGRVLAVMPREDRDAAAEAAIAADRAAGQPPPPVRTPSRWVARHIQDAITREHRYVVAQTGAFIDGTRGRPAPTISMVCSQRVLSIYIRWDETGGWSGATMRVGVRIGLAPGTFQEWRVWRDTWTSSAPNPQALLAAMLTEDVGVFQGMWKGTVEYDLRGLREASEQLRQACPPPAPRPAQQPARPQAR